MNIDLELALFEADHGSPRAALAAATAEWNRRQSILVADALAWALHVNGHDRDALRYERIAMHLGLRNALFWFHCGMIQRSLGNEAAARRDLATALHMNPYFSLLRAREARSVLVGAR